MIVIDPVCGMDVETETAEYKTSYKGRDYYFCAESCRESFKADPRKYLNAADNGGIMVDAARKTKTGQYVDIVIPVTRKNDTTNIFSAEKALGEQDGVACERSEVAVQPAERPCGDPVIGRGRVGRAATAAIGR